MASHTRYHAFGPELIPVYRQSAHRLPWAHVSQPPNGISISSAVFAYTTAKSPNAFQWGGQPLNDHFPLRDLDHI